MAEQPAGSEKGPEPAKPSFLAQAAKAFSQLALTFYVLLLILALMAPMVPTPYLGMLMAILAVVPLALGPKMYREIGCVALLIAGAVYVSAKPPARGPGAVAPQKSPASPSTPAAPAAPAQTPR